MADEAGTKCCLVVLCGLPATGKTCLTREFMQWNREHNSKDLHVVHVCFDDHIPSDLNLNASVGEKCDEKTPLFGEETQENTQWKLFRKLLLRCTEELIKRLQNGSFTSCRDVQMEGNSEKKGTSNSTFPTLSEFWVNFLLKFWKMERSCQCFRSSNEPSCAPLHVIFIDDNMFYRSMRYEYLQLARNYSLGYAQVYINSSVNTALARNMLRKDSPVTKETIITMATKLEPPNPDKYPWELCSVTLDGAQPCPGNGEILMELVTTAAANPVLPLVVGNEEEKGKLREANLASVIHQTDQVLRKIISKQMVESKGKGDGKKQLQLLAQSLNTRRKNLLEKLRRTDTQCCCIPYTNTTETSNVDNEQVVSQSTSYQCIVHGGSCTLQVHLYKLMETSREEFQEQLQNLFSSYC